MKTLYEVIEDTTITISEITSEEGHEKLWKVITAAGEELVGKIGYKVFNSDWSCTPRGPHTHKQYAVGEKFEEEVKLDLCGSGMHYCPNAADCFNYYRFDPENKVALVLAYGDVEGGRR